MNKSEIRRQMRARRRALSLPERWRAARGLCRVLRVAPVFMRARRIGLYLANDGELDPQVLMALAWRRRKQVFLPVLQHKPFQRMRFAPYLPGDELVPNRYGIPEPCWDAAVPGRCLDLVLMPLVAFDAAGNRLGMGGGYYDRSFAYLRRRRHWRRPVLLGVGYDFQQHPALPGDVWDVPMDGVVTESRLLLLTRQ